LKNLVGFSYKNLQVILKKPAGSTCADTTFVEPCKIIASSLAKSLNSTKNLRTLVKILSNKYAQFHDLMSFNP
jgi:hypothetical protein